MPYDLENLNSSDLDVKESILSKKKIAIYIFSLIILIFLAGLIFLNFKISTGLSKDSTQRPFTIVPGQTSKQVSRNLYKQGFISSSLIFDIYVYATNRTSKIQAGEYMLAKNMTMKQILGEFVTGKTKKEINVIRVKEGTHLEELADQLADAGITSKQEFLDALVEFSSTFKYFGETPKEKTLEGYLFPDTYFTYKKTTNEDLIAKAVNNLDKKLTPELRAEIKKQNKSIYEVLTLASVVEREVGRNTSNLDADDVQALDEERKIVAGIFLNRLNIGMALESDATVEYVTKSGRARATYDDLKIDSPYNTYKYRGLPPGPISSPSMPSILAVIYPTETDYLFFLSKPDGTAVYGKTLKEHNANREKYLE